MFFTDFQLENEKGKKPESVWKLFKAGVTGVLIFNSKNQQEDQSPD